MPTSLAEARNNATDDLDLTVIDEFRKSSDILDRLTFDNTVNPTGGGDTLTYGYRRLITQANADFRPLNTEYTPAEVQTQRYTVDLTPLGGSFRIDRVISRIGPAASGAVALNMSQKIKASRAKFADAVINGDKGTETAGFDGLSKILTGTDTEYLPLANGVATGYLDWTSIGDKAAALAAQRHIDAWLASMDDTPDVIYGNAKTLAIFKTVAAWTDQLDKGTDAFGRPVTSYNGIPLIDLKSKAGSNAPVIGLVTRDPDGAGGGANVSGLGDLYAIRYGLDGFHGASVASVPLVQTWLPDFNSSGAVKLGEVEMGPLAPVLKATRAAAVLRNIKSV
ncbi:MULTISPECIES: major capsid protein [unclassified Streptomyces]|uniref:major capsid protein n=1 Tax=unclassified Streptomyces TaxID=2593676 RepID=UPI0006B0398A|nr:MULTISPECIES: phage capsid protein [unclassified Streptomyces]KOX33069.1 phage capsid protein [Streptomyces sp. NRRL F-6491]KOX36218.1 phage capsid protein [Streptomyces sp. NRRL F-6492]